ncbi:hypothetical protein [Acidocella facilis]|uniref:hypothetical protein n=1 Tax=Acidocella facilis TaxID=525 RepID=UPI001F3CC3CC|nr:hypothetical protein [Acidocella facilis]
MKHRDTSKAGRQPIGVPIDDADTAKPLRFELANDAAPKTPRAVHISTASQGLAQIIRTPSSCCAREFNAQTVDPRHNFVRHLASLSERVDVAQTYVTRGKRAIYRANRRLSQDLIWDVYPARNCAIAYQHRSKPTDWSDLT